MNQEDFYHLLKKFEEGKCSEYEKYVLFEFYENLQNTYSDKDFLGFIPHSEETEIRLLKRINSTIQKSEARKGQKNKWRWLGGIAALFFGILTTGVFLFNKTSSETIIPPNAITLELEDGTIRVLESNGTSILKNNKGSVYVVQEGGQLIYNLDSEIKELAYNTLNVPYGKTFSLKLSDGTVAHLNSGSSIRYPVKFLNGSDRKVFITGEAYFDVSHDASTPFIVNANDLNIRVLGTEFNIRSYTEDDIADVVLVDGSVALYYGSNTYEKMDSILLEPNHKAIFSKNNKDIQIRPVNTDIYTSWRNGELVFRDMSFENILKKMERHYNVTIVNKSNLSGTVFNASFGIVPIEKVLQELKEVYNLSYKIENNVITIN